MSGKKINVKAEGYSVREVFRQFIARKKSDGLSPATIKGYVGQFGAISKFMDTEADIDTVTDRTMQRVFADMSDTDLSRNSIRSYSAVMMSFFSWCREEGFCDVKIRLFKGEESPPDIYTDEELVKLLKHPARRKMTFTELRGWALVNLLVNNGVRAGTIREIKNEDVHIDRSVIFLRHTKNRRSLSIPLSETLIEVLREYMRVRGGDPSDYLFCNVEGGQMADSCLRSAIKTYNRSRGVEKCGIHAFRHTFARLYIVECGGDALKLQKLLGHSTLKMTQHYVKIFDEDLVKDFQEHSPLEKIKKG